MVVYSSGSQLEWREVEGGQLPEPRSGLRASLVGEILFVTGGYGVDGNDLTSILSWDPVAESWQQAGDLAVGREFLFVSGGFNGIYGNYLTSILSWDPVAESWQPAGDLDVAREYHAAVAVPTSLVQC